MGRDTSSYSARRGSRGLSDLDDKIDTIIVEEILLNLVELDFALNPCLTESNQYYAIDALDREDLTPEIAKPTGVKNSPEGGKNSRERSRQIWREK
jgi:hypothetical protein